ncbi:hypothetical protein ACFQU1_10475 [Chelatococcus sp. GCM10030263]|uniref:hypothetical protein n=1 Tax=Chelatococcus sp. GCM10030263 TaxID=3273387 RepID=UPI00360F4C5D
MRHATWTTIESTPTALRLYRYFRRLPERIRRPLAFIAMPRWHLATASVRRAADGRVLSGPFAGMRMELTQTSRRQLLGYLLGTQELELRPAIEQIIARGYRTILNVGAADGYYAIGLAMKLPGASVVAFEALPEHHSQLRRAAKANGVAERVRLQGFCSACDLDRELRRAAAPAILVADIEGGEIDLLAPDKINGLRQTDILVETHDALVPGVTDILISRFRTTHDIERIWARPRRLSDFPKGVLPRLPLLLPDTTVELMNERRQGRQQWLFLTAKETASGAAPSGSRQRRGRNSGDNA